MFLDEFLFYFSMHFQGKLSDLIYLNPFDTFLSAFPFPWQRGSTAQMCELCVSAWSVNAQQFPEAIVISTSTSSLPWGWTACQHGEWSSHIPKDTVSRGQRNEGTTCQAVPAVLLQLWSCTSQDEDHQSAAINIQGPVKLVLKTLGLSHQIIYIDGRFPCWKH